MKCDAIMAVRLDRRRENSVKLQETLTKHGCAISARFGIHEAGDRCAEDGLILLCLTGDKSEFSALEKDLKALEGIGVKMMDL